MIPDEVIHVRPVLSVAFSWVLLSVGEFEGVEGRLRDAERWLDATTGTGAGSITADWMSVPRNICCGTLPQGGPVRRAGHHRLVLGRKGPTGRLSRQGPEVLRWAVYEAGQDPRPRLGPRPRLHAAVKDRKDGKRAALSEARKILRQASHILAELGDDALTAA